ncbi:uncharacterized protein BP01DRAFT_335473 [Aspergillus saccharolyticus JOP 1030-1]|uniref:Uncharacterized protein n=1 Tax=Aspergillus saccharolyticus JOP 1030-1 TaxID=1450539 RepID=A0A318ZJU5_9EURO|nr:hypothetical protein BP01DRAFT_335473 [Aspergillus saccharolyticus JOP 1030-1]PYH47851.1 hypothetical protein BP01DRAFT_335473 [Aspergillus saccharolyticus JOP 1030-1]
MRLLILGLWMMLAISPITATFSATCLKAIVALTSRPHAILEHFQHEVCDQGCRPTLSHWDLWTRNHTFVPAVRSLLVGADQPAQQEEAMKRLGDEVAALIKRQCGPILGGRDVCADRNTLAAFGTCFQKSFVRVALAYWPQLLPLASEPICRAQYEWVQQSRLWEEIIPGKMREYAGVCQQLGGEMMVMREMYSF